MKFKIDENLPTEIADLLSAAGHEPMTVLNQNLKGAQDSDIAEICRQETRCLVTLDLDFADIRTYPPEKFPGIVVVRVVRQDRQHLLEIIQRVIPLFDQNEVAGHLWIVEEARVRIRGKED